MSTTTLRWTKELPKESGFYWYRDPVPWEGARDNGWEIVDFDVEEKNILFCGNDIGRGGYWSREIDGEFYSERLTPPTP